MSSQKKVTNKNKAIKNSRKRLFIASALLIFLVSFYVCSLFSDWMQIFSDKKEVNTLSKEYENLLEQEASLQSEVTKLQDTEYIARYAREKYSFSKDDGEIILRIPDMEKSK